jgi:hypothetical protein
MAIAHLVTTPEGFTSDMYDSVSAQMDVAGNPPDGMIFHTAAVINGRFTIFDVWESEEHIERFWEDRLRPAQIAVMGEEAFAAAPEPDEVRAEVHNLVKP